MAEYLKIDHNQLISLGEYIRILRINKGLGLREMASMLDISSAYLSNLEMGKHSKANPLILMKIAEILNVDHLRLYKIIGYTNKDLGDLKAEIKSSYSEKETSNKRMQKIIQYMNNFSLEEFDLVERYFKLLKESNISKKDKKNKL